MKDKKALIEAALFVSENPLTLDKLSKISGVKSGSELKGIIQQIKQEFDDDSRGVELVLTGEGYQFQVKDKFLQNVVDLSTHSDLSGGCLRTLGLVALRQPVLQSEIVKIQGNKAYNYIKRLEKRKLVDTEKAGRTRLLRTTREFERYFGKGLEEIKRRLEGVTEVEDVNTIGQEKN